MKHPGHLHTIVLNFGPNVPAFQQHYRDRSQAMRIMQTLQGKCKRAGVIDSIELWHGGKMLSSYTPNPETVVWLPPPDEAGVRHIAEGVSSVNATCLADWERFGKPKDMLGKIKKPKRLPSQLEYDASGMPII